MSESLDGGRLGPSIGDWPEEGQVGRVGEGNGKDLDALRGPDQVEESRIIDVLQTARVQDPWFQGCPDPVEGDLGAQDLGIASDARLQIVAALNKIKKIKSSNFQIETHNFIIFEQQFCLD